MAAPRPLHLHIGLGALGGGLVLAEHDPAAADLVVVGRTSPAPLSAQVGRTGAVRVRVAGVERRVAVPELVRADTRTGHDRLVELVSADRPLLVTTTVKEGQPAVVDLLDDLLARRPPAPGAVTVVVPCENAWDPRWEAVRARRRAVLARHVLVDRICTQVVDGDEVVVEAEDHVEWKVGFDAGDDGALATCAGMALSDDIVFEKQRKLLLVNGVQFAAAALCLRDGHVEMTTYLATAAGALALRGLLLECSLVLAEDAEGPGHGIEEILAHARVAGDRIARTPDDAMRVLAGGATDRQQWLTEVCRKMALRLDEPLLSISRILGTTRLSGSMLGKARLAVDEVIDRVVALGD